MVDKSSRALLIANFEAELVELCQKHQIKIVCNEVWGMAFYRANDPNTAYYDEPRNHLKENVWEIGPEGVK